jgi:hypothetical protein
MCMKYIVKHKTVYYYLSTVFAESGLPIDYPRLEYSVFTTDLFPTYEIEETQDGQKLRKVTLPFTAYQYYLAISPRCDGNYVVYGVITEPQLHYHYLEPETVKAVEDYLRSITKNDLYKELKELRKNAPLVLSREIKTLTPLDYGTVDQLNLAVAGLEHKAEAEEYVNLRGKQWFLIYPPLDPKYQDTEFKVEKVRLKNYPEVVARIPVFPAFSSELAKTTTLALRATIHDYTWIKGYLQFAVKYRVSHPVKWSAK